MICGRTALGGWWGGSAGSQYCTGGKSTFRAQRARLGLLTRWGRAFEGQELRLSGCCLLKLQSRIEFNLLRGRGSL